MGIGEITEGGDVTVTRVSEIAGSGVPEPGPRLGPEPKLLHIQFWPMSAPEQKIPAGATHYRYSRMIDGPAVLFYGTPEEYGVAIDVAEHMEGLKTTEEVCVGEIPTSGFAIFLRRQGERLLEIRARKIPSNAWSLEKVEAV